MPDPIRELKTRAELLHHALQTGEPSAVLRLRAWPSCAGPPRTSLTAFLPDVQRKHTLAIVAREAGFDDWAHAHTLLSGGTAESFGTLLCPPTLAAHWNIWSAHYDEARSIRREHGGYLLAYKQHFFIADRYYIEALGLDPEDTDWERMGRDWVRPAYGGAQAAVWEGVGVQGWSCRGKAGYPRWPLRRQAREPSRGGCVRDSTGRARPRCASKVAHRRWEEAPVAWGRTTIGCPEVRSPSEGRICAESWLRSPGRVADIRAGASGSLGNVPVPADGDSLPQCATIP